MRREKLGKLGLVFIGVSVVCISLGISIELIEVGQYGERETLSIEAEQYVSYQFTIDEDINEIGYDVEVVEGPFIDVYVLTESDYARYLDGLGPIDDDSMVFEVVDRIHGSPYLFRGSYWFVLDNSDYGTANIRSENATVEYRFSPLEPEREPGISTFLVLSGAFVLFLVLGVAFIVGGYADLDMDRRTNERS